MQKTTDRVKTRNPSSANLKDLKKRVLRIDIQRVEESFPELWQQGFVRFANPQDQKKKEENLKESVCRNPANKDSLAASEMWTMALKENQDRKGKDPHICPFCDKFVLSRWSLRRHIRRTHDVKRTLQTSSKVTNGHTPESSLRRCTVCGKGFFTALALRKHIALHNLECKICKKQFTKLEHLEAHKQSHFQDLSYRCEKCSKIFTSQNDLQQHSFIHSDTKPFSCKVCNTQFTSEQSLNIHKKQHEVKTCQSSVEVQKNNKWMVIIHSWPSTAP